MKKSESIKDSLIETGKNLGSGLVGMVAGSAVGRHSLWIGAATIFGGAWYQHDWLTSAGVGMVASNGFGGNNSNVSGMDGFQDELSNAKERAISSLKALGKKVYLDKLSPSLGEKLGLGDLEDTTFIMMEDDSEIMGELAEFDTSEVDEIIRQLEDGNTDEVINDQVFEEQFNEGDFRGTESIGELGNQDIMELNGTDAMELNASA
ncbi:MAG: hypothetical protein AAGA02_00165 [Bacteroidota bacterium]